jgi:hypothetical protein
MTLVLLAHQASEQASPQRGKDQSLDCIEIADWQCGSQNRGSPANSQPRRMRARLAADQTANLYTGQNYRREAVK